MSSAPAGGTTPESHTLRIGAMLDAHEARCLVVDPVSALIYEGASESAADAVLGLLDLAKRRGVTVLMTSQVDGSDPSEENTAIGISSIADTWMHLSYVASGGERNRALTIVKSRGTGHSNQVRELILSSQGLSLVDVYTAGGAVLMGTPRRQKEEQERAERARVVRAEQVRHDEIASTIAETQTRIAGLRADVLRKKAEWRLLKETSQAGAATGAANLAVLRRLRGADMAPKKAGRSSTGSSLRRRK
jgi:circadian clock protein KaiC